MKGIRLPPLFSRRLPALGLGEVRKRWWAVVAIFAAYAVIAVTIYVTSGLGEWSPQFDPIGRSLALAVGFFFLPSLVEELGWRWLLIPPACWGKLDARSAGVILLSSVVFTAAHPVAAWLFVPHAREVFVRPEFLTIVLLLGLACGASYVVTKSIWPPVTIHWLTVLVWKFLLGGPFILLGR